MKEKYARKYMVQIRDGVGGKSILHRDIKPQNLLISDTFNGDFDEVAKILITISWYKPCGSPIWPPR